MGDTTVTTLDGRDQAIPQPVADEATGRSVLRRLRTPRRPRFWFEILLVAVSYWTYSLIRNAVPEQRSEALSNADWIWKVEHHLGIAVEDSVNRAVNSVEWLVVGMNYYYATLHFVVTLGVLVWLYRRHPGRYAATRLALFATTAVALVGYYFYPLAPPRLMTNSGFIDTVLVHQTWGSMASGDLKHMSNQYAAMPSMHIGWSVWCGLTIFVLASVPWVRVLGVVYPAVTLVVIVATANHFWLDAVGGLLCLAFGFLVAGIWYGSSPYTLPRRPPAVNGVSAAGSLRGRRRALSPAGLPPVAAHGSVVAGRAGVPRTPESTGAHPGDHDSPGSRVPAEAEPLTAPENRRTEDGASPARPRPASRA
ncbi:phosphatase PAP2 family protein [Streptomyces phyllanthi]|uniref:phosphatase PAP2 family protein n=1 Tax=Streptomyces phyllanthi TaxID=1803180 RepID=UPI001D144B8E|nr:phosphatase PAP2 family protein [Streptomyces phyllanthi]